MPGIVVNSDRRTAQVWNWCKESFAKVGHILRFPQHTDPQKTYQWRSAQKLARQLEEWDFDDSTCQIFIDQVAAHAKQKKLLRKGLSVFFQANALQVCYNRLKASSKMSESSIEALIRTKSFLEQNCKQSILEGLLDRPHPDAFYNMITWYDLGNLSKTYIAISKSCTKALAKIAKNDAMQRELLPSRSELFIVGRDFMTDISKRSAARKELGSDWRELCR